MPGGSSEHVHSNRVRAFPEIALDNNAIHELRVQEINRVFRELGGEHDSKWIWESAG